MKYFQKSYSLLFILLLVIAGCSVPVYDQYEYEQATSLKVESLVLMDKATEDFSTQKDAVEKLKLELEKAYEYSAGRENNEISTKQWSIIKDPDRNLMGGFLKMWESEKALSDNFIGQAKGLVSDAFDTIIEYEGAKGKY